MRSPITRSENVELVDKISTDRIKNLWELNLEMDISGEFEEEDKIKKYRCKDTDLIFFRPKTLEGSEKVYSRLKEKKWYYMKSKWEYNRALKEVEKGSSCLVVGCGEGHFVEKLNEKGSEAKGIELSKEAVDVAKQKGRNVHLENLKVTSKNEKEKYQYVCAFQVLEHVVDPKKFLKNCVSCLSEKGKIIIGVPNMDGYMGDMKEDILNMPPHHMTQWFPETFRSLPEYLPISLKSINFEPLATHHRSAYARAQIDQLLGGSFPEIISKASGFVLSQILRVPQLRQLLRGHTQVVIFEKL